jgi:hypothetical protein
LYVNKEFSPFHRSVRVRHTTILDLSFFKGLTNMKYSVYSGSHHIS